MSEITWELSNGAVAVPESRKKMPFVSPIKVTKEMYENQKKLFTTYNAMQKELIDIGLMESK